MGVVKLVILISQNSSGNSTFLVIFHLGFLEMSRFVGPLGTVHTVTICNRHELRWAQELRAVLALARTGSGLAPWMTESFTRQSNMAGWKVSYFIWMILDDFPI